MKITNTGAVRGDEVVQLYIHQQAGRASRPVRLLQGFQRVSLAPGESRELTFTLDESNVRYWNSGERGWVIDPGTFDLWLGNSAKADLHTTFTVGGKGTHADHHALWINPRNSKDMVLGNDGGL